MKQLKLLGLSFLTSLLACCGKPDLPVAITFREATMEKSKVAQIHNNSNEVMKITITATGKDNVSKTSSEILLQPSKPLEVGWLEGWSFISGEKIAISSPGFSDYKISIP